jgi:ABC-type transporter Mla subunit MlaD
MNDNKAKKRPIWVIIGVLLILLLFAGVFFGVEDNPFRKPALRFSIQFDDVTGIRERSKVYFLGIPIGYVRRLEYDPAMDDSSIKVDIVMTRKIKLPATVTAHLEPTLLGDASISLRPSGGTETTTQTAPGSKTAPEPALLAEGALIRGERATKLEAVMPGFDAAMAKVVSLASATGERLSNMGEMVDRSVSSLSDLFLAKGANGQTQIDSLITTLQELINGPAGQEDKSVRAQLEAIVSNLQTSSESVKQFADVQSKEPGSIGKVLQVFEDTARKLSNDASTAQKVISRMGRTSDAVAKASDQVNVLASKASDAVTQFNSRPLHYLTSTRPVATPAPTPKK